MSHISAAEAMLRKQQVRKFCKNVAGHSSEMSTLHALVRQYYYPMVIQGNQNQLSIILGITHNT